MFAFKKILTPFLLPPGIFIVLLILSGIWFTFKLKKYWKFGLFNCLIGTLLWVLSISPVSDAMLRGLEYEFNIPKNPEGDVILLLGGGAYGEVPDLSGVGAPSGDMLERMVTAVRLQKKYNVPIVISGGKVFKHKKAEAPIVRRFLIDLGVPANKVIVEDRSRDTIENARYTSEILKKNGYKKPLLVTSAYHMKRSILSFEKAGIKVIPFPAGFKTWQNKIYGWEDYLPDMAALESVYIALHEYSGLLFYRFVY
jgi:uncharacterized SAM-binding protein YcdF (DUF218 family)